MEVTKLRAVLPGDAVVIDAPEGSPWAWLNGKPMTAGRHFGGNMWLSCEEEAAGVMTKKEFIAPVELLRRVRAA